MKQKGLKWIVALLLSLIVSTVGMSFAPSNTLSRFEQAVNNSDLETVVDLYYELVAYYHIDSEADLHRYASLFKKGGDVCYYNQRYLDALEYYTLAMEAARKCDNEELYCRAVGNIGLVYNSLNNHHRALYYLETVYEKIRDNGDPTFRRECLKNLIVTECNIGDTKAARSYNAELKKLLNPQVPLDAYNLNSMDAVILQTEKHYREACDYYMAAETSAKKARMESLYIAPCVLEAANCSAKSGDRERASNLFARALALAKANNMLAYEADAYSYMAEEARTYGDSVGFGRYMAMSDSVHKLIYNDDKFENAQNRLHGIENELHREREQLLNARIKWQVAVIVTFVVLLIVLLIFFLSIRSKNRKLREAYKLLIRKEELISGYEENKISETIATGGKEAAPTDKDVAGLGISPQQYKDLTVKINALLKDPKFLFSPDCSLSTLSRKVGSNNKYVSLTINSFFKKNFKSLVNELRVREAARRLTDSSQKDAKIADMAQELGYQSSTVFINAFKAILGMTPGAYKRAVAAADSTSDEPKDQE